MNQYVACASGCSTEAQATLVLINSIDFAFTFKKPDRIHEVSVFQLY